MSALTQSGILGSAEHNGSQDHLQPLHGDLGLTVFDQLGDTITKVVPIVQWFGSKEAEQGVQLFDVVLNRRANISQV